MGFTWTLLVEVREGADSVGVDMTLLDEERRWQWRAHREIDRNQFDHQRRFIQRCFAVNCPSRGQDMTRLAQIMSTDLSLQEFLDTSRLDEGSCLVINTTVTSVPWDLLLFRGNLLGSELVIGLNIPIANESYFKKAPGRTPRSLEPQDVKPRFLHIVADPKRNLPQSKQEQQELEAIVAEHPVLEYHPMKNPSVQEILDEFGNPGLRFLHFTGHIEPRKGLVVGKRGRAETLKIVNIEKRFPGSDGQIVFLNGCDAHLDEPDSDLFATATVANAFLYGGAMAVIAPRSRVSDEDALDAAVYIWRSLLVERVPLGAAVRDYRRTSIDAKPNALGGYTYILYGNSCLYAIPDQSSNQPDTLSKRIFEHPLVREAAIDAGGDISPRHLFGALTRRRSLGRVFFDSFDQEYVLLLTQLRRNLGCRRILPRQESPPSVNFSSGAELVIDALPQVAAPDESVTEMDFLNAIRRIGDPEILGAIRQLEIPGWDLKEICETAKLCSEEDPVPWLFQPDGWANPDRLLCGLYNPDPALQDTTQDEGTVDLWDLFSAMVRADGHIGAFSKDSGCPRSPSGSWSCDVPLHWSFLTDAAHSAIQVAAKEMKDEQAQCTSESHLLYALFGPGDFDWELLPEDAKAWFGSKADWERFAKLILLERLGWPNA